MPELPASGPLRVGVVGVGHLGKHHARLLAGLDGVRLVAVADVHGDAARAAAEAHGTAEAPITATTAYEELIGAVDAVCVAVPTNLHREVAGRFLEAGVDVLVEKPIAATVAEARELVELAERHERILQVGHVERFNAAFRALLDQRLEPRYVECQRLAPFTFRSTDIGVVLDLMIHDLDLVLALIDAPLASVDAFGGALFTPAEDMVSATLRFESGAVAQLSATRVALKALRKMRVFSKSGYASVDFSDGQGMVIRKQPGWDVGKLDVSAVDPKAQDLWKYVFEGLLKVERYGLDGGNPLRDELAHFVDCVRTRAEPMVDGRAGLAALEAAERVLEAVARHPW